MRFLKFLIIFAFLCGPAFSLELDDAKSFHLKIVKEAYLKMDKHYYKEIDKVKVANMFYKNQYLFFNFLDKSGSDFLSALEDFTYSTVYMMVEALKDKSDTYSKFIRKEYLKRVVRESVKSGFSGIGIEVRYEKKGGEFFIAKVYDNSSAYYEGVEVGDKLLEVGGRSVSGLKLGDVEKMLNIPNGDTVKLKLLRPEDNKVYEVKLKCKIIKVPSVEAEFFEDGKIFYFRIKSFRDKTFNEFIKELILLEDKEPKGVILDLRGNGGGDETAVVKLSGIFLKEGSLVCYFLKRGVGRVEERSKGSFINLNLPVVVLVDRNSASSSEIFAGALRYYGKAVIVGENTKGSGSLKNTIPLSDGSALFLITSRTYLPDGATFDGVGIEPDIRTASSEALKKGVELIRNGRFGR